MKTHPTDHVFSFTKPLCPYCQGKLTATANCWEQESDGTWIATDLDLTCSSEPDIEGDEWDGWWDRHSNDYCQGWHETHDKLIAHLKRTARFNLSDKLTKS